MNKMNKKGFTLIEMLVVIAIIAVLVSIIIPTVTSATTKAQAATTAANLRSIKASVVTDLLTGGVTEAEIAAGYTPDNAGSIIMYTTGGDKSNAGDGKLEITGSKAAGITVKYDGLTIDQWAVRAGS